MTYAPSGDRHVKNLSEKSRLPRSEELWGLRSSEEKPEVCYSRYNQSTINQAHHTSMTSRKHIRIGLVAAADSDIAV
jgi:hypothetical protein